MPDITCPLCSASDRHGSELALILPDRQIDYFAFSGWVSMIAGGMRRRGWREGDRIALILPNSAEYAVVLAAMFRLRIVACPLNTRLPIQALRRQITLLQCRAVITDHVYMLGEIGVEVLAVKDLKIRISDGYPVEVAISLAQPATIVYTSGSSGNPKAAMHTYGSHYHNALGSGENIPFGPGDRWLLSLPLYHVGAIGILFRAWLGAGTVVIPDRTESLPTAIRRHKITHLSLVSTQLHRLMTKANFGAGNLKHVLLGGSAMPPSLIEKAVKAGLPIHTSYGSTEMASQVTTTSLTDIPDKLHTSGKPLPYRQIKVTRDGDILVRGETLFAGYVHGQELDPTVDADGWFHTGDVGYCDAAGYLIVSGRRDAMFISGGENIHPEEIETALLNLSYVTRAVVVPKVDTEFGSRAVAFVELAGRSRLPIAEIKEILGRTLPRYKIPVRILPWPEEITAGIKPDRVWFTRLAEESVDLTD